MEVKCVMLLLLISSCFAAYTVQKQIVDYTESPGNQFSITFDGAYYYIASYNGSLYLPIYKVDAISNQIVATGPATAKITAMTYKDRNLYVKAVNSSRPDVGKIYEVDRNTLQLIADVSDSNFNDTTSAFFYDSSIDNWKFWDTSTSSDPTTCNLNFYKFDGTFIKQEKYFWISNPSTVYPDTRMHYSSTFDEEFIFDASTKTIYSVVASVQISSPTSISTLINSSLNSAFAGCTDDGLVWIVDTSSNTWKGIFPYVCSTESWNETKSVTIQCGDSIDPYINTVLGKPLFSCNTKTLVPYSNYTDNVIKMCTTTRIKVIERNWYSTILGKNNTFTQNITILIPAPTINITNNITIESDELSPTKSGYPTVMDDCGDGSNITFQYNDTILYNGNCSSYSIILRNWTAIDECGETVTTSQYLNVNFPTLYIPPNKNVECPDSIHPNVTGWASSSEENYSVMSHDDVIQVTCTTPTIYQIVTRTWTVIDSCGSRNGIQTITVMDNTAPIIYIPPNVSMECNDTLSNSTLGWASGYDTCSGPLNATFIESYPNMDDIDVCTSGILKKKTIFRTWFVMDSCGYTNSSIQSIYFKDTYAPNFLKKPIDHSIILDKAFNCNYAAAINLVGDIAANVSFTDNCDMDPSFTNNVYSFSLNCSTLHITWALKDWCNNNNTYEQVITINPPPPPPVSTGSTLGFSLFLISLFIIFL